MAAVFATAWASAGLLVAHFPPVAILLPALISGALLLWAYQVPSTARDMGDRGRKLILRWSLVKGAAIFIGANLLQRAHRADAAYPLVAIIVGLHCLPLARGMALPLYYGMAAGLVLVGAGGMLLSAVERPIVVGLGAAAILWATAVYRILEARRPLAV